MSRSISSLMKIALGRLPLKVARSAYQAICGQVLSGRDSIRHYLPSVVYSLEDSKTNPFLISLVAAAAKSANINEIIVPKDGLSDNVFYNIFPGEHYRLLKAIANILEPDTIVEVGTFSGMGTIALSQGFPNAKLITYDIVSWDKYATHLTIGDFERNIVQVLCDLSDSSYFNSNLEILNRAKLIFVDAPKDGQFEKKFLTQLRDLAPMKGKILILDDIKFINMIDLWRSIKSPKIDVTSFGHWSGTGIVDISEGLDFWEPERNFNNCS